MQVVLQGSLRHLPAAELLAFLCNRGGRGTLDLESGGVRTRVCFDGTTLLHAESSGPADAMAALVDLLSWAEGTFTLLDTAVLPEGAAPMSLPLQELLEEAKRRAEAASPYPPATTFRVVDDTGQQHVSLSGAEFRLLFRVSSGKSFRDLVTELGLSPRELGEKLKKLEQLKLLEIVREEEPTPLPAAPARKTTASRRRTMVGSLTPDDAPDNVYPLLDEICTIGRAPANALSIPDGSVSTNHARIVRTPEGFILEDLNSRNGTFVNGEKVEGSRKLADGDLIRLGKVIMTFNVARETPSGDMTAPEVRIE